MKLYTKFEIEKVLKSNAGLLLKENYKFLNIYREVACLASAVRSFHILVPR